MRQFHQAFYNFLQLLNALLTCRRERSAVYICKQDVIEVQVEGDNTKESFF
jgi:hypothetical protein